LAHHIRNPLTSILTAAELLKEPGGREPELVEWAGVTIERQARQLNQIVTDLLDFSRVARSELRLGHEVVDLKALVQDAVEDCRPLAEKQRQTLGLQLPEGALCVLGDRLRLRQIMDNLLGNAVKFTPTGGEVTVAARLEAGEAVIRVRDTGIGLEPPQLERIFAPFLNARSSKSSDRAGLGVGLALSRGLADIHRGSLIAHSQGLGKGSEFELRIPARDRPPG
jgi:signal transduction histidine kinase